MDDRRFDALAKSLAAPRSRRSFLLRSVSAAIGGALAATRSRTAEAGPVPRGVGTICRKNNECDSGVCSPPDFTGRGRCICPTGLQACGDRCVDPQTAFLRDAANCGACGTRCAGGKICCDGSCVAPDSACGASCCTVPQVCYQSACCLPNDRSITCNGKCGPQVDNCGQTVTCDSCCKDAGQACGSNAACCSGICVSGTCAAGPSQLGGPCDETADCAVGVCCAGICTNPATFQTDLANCGACGNACPAAAPECGTTSCVGGVCGGTFASYGTETSAQTAGDCTKSVCNGAGQIISIADDTDKPSTTNACLTGACSNGQSSFLPRAAGTGCSQNGGTVCDGSGNCVVCVPNATLPCYTGPAGTVGIGICHAGTITCNAQGSSYGPCTGEVIPGSETSGGCNGFDDDCDGVIDNGVCPPIPHGTSGCIDSGCGILACDTGYEDCNGSFEDGCETDLTSNPDHCGACDNPCPDSTECATVSCVSGACETQPSPANTPLTNQTAGDCRTNVCDGQGGETTIPDDSDAPADDGTGCTESVCSGGALSVQNKTAGVSCGANAEGLCDGNGSCVECLIDSDCASDVCLPDNTCCQLLVPAEFCAGQCGIVTGICQTEDCGPCCTPADDSCDVNDDCCSGVCLDGLCAAGPRQIGESCDEDADCADGSCCGNVCVAISAFTDDVLNCGSCGNVCDADTTDCSWPICVAGECGTGYAASGTPLIAQTDGDCVTEVCDGSGGITFEANDEDLPPDDGAGCDEPICDGGSPSSQPRSTGTSCETGYCDGAGICVECTEGQHCSSGVCLSDNTCCVRDGFEITCAGVCGPQIDNCGLSVECEPCATCNDGYEPGSDGVTCVPTEATCYATLDAAFPTLFDADFRECNFANAEFGPKNLIRANFTGANLVGANFNRTNLSGANFSGADLTSVSWALAICPDDYAIPNFSGEKCCTHLNGAVPSACT